MESVRVGGKFYPVRCKKFRILSIFRRRRLRNAPLSANFSSMKKLSIIVAMRGEAEALVSELGLKKVVPNDFFEGLPFLFYQGTFINKLKLTFTVPGLDARYNVDSIGTEPAAVAAFATINEFKPDLLLNLGTAGSFQKKGAHIGKVYLSDSAFYFHDHRIPIEGWDKFGIGAYPSLDVKNLALKIGCERGNISSGNSLDFTPEDLSRIESSGAILKEMEAGAIAWVAFITKTPFFALKSVTNLIDVNSDSPGEFEKNFQLAVQSLTEKALELVKILSGEDWPVLKA